MARGWDYTKLSLSSALLLSFSDMCFVLLFLSFGRFNFVFRCLFSLCSHWSFVDIPLIFSSPANHVPDWQPRILLGMVEARSVNVKNTTTTTTAHSSPVYAACVLYNINLTDRASTIPSNMRGCQSGT